jgi:hypothetical protein
MTNLAGCASGALPTSNQEYLRVVCEAGCCVCAEVPYSKVGFKFVFVQARVTSSGLPVAVVKQQHVEASHHQRSDLRAALPDAGAQLSEVLLYF